MKGSQNQGMQVSKQASEISSVKWGVSHERKPFVGVVLVVW
jgi:hypothetical protein